MGQVKVAPKKVFLVNFGEPGKYTARIIQPVFTLELVTTGTNQCSVINIL